MIVKVCHIKSKLPSYFSFKILSFPQFSMAQPWWLLLAAAIQWCTSCLRKCITDRTWYIFWPQRKVGNAIWKHMNTAHLKCSVSVYCLILLKVYCNSKVLRCYVVELWLLMTCLRILKLLPLELHNINEKEIHVFMKISQAFSCKNHWTEHSHVRSHVDTFSILIQNLDITCNIFELFENLMEKMLTPLHNCVKRVNVIWM